MAYSTTSSANGSSSPWSTASSSRTRQPVLASGKRSPLAAKVRERLFAFQPGADAVDVCEQSTHPLRTNYTFTTTYRVPGAKTDEQDWASHIRTLAQVGSIESFWVIWTHLKLPSELEIGREYHLFREGVRPIWEDASNHEGGKAILRLRKGVSDRVWLDLVLAMIGERLLSDSAESRRRLPRLGEAEETDPSDDICGCTLSIRKDEDVITVCPVFVW